MNSNSQRIRNLKAATSNTYTYYYYHYSAYNQYNYYGAYYQNSYFNPNGQYYLGYYYKTSFTLSKTVALAIGIPAGIMTILFTCLVVFCCCTKTKFINGKKRIVCKKSTKKCMCCFKKKQKNGSPKNKMFFHPNDVSMVAIKPQAYMIEQTMPSQQSMIQPQPLDPMFNLEPTVIYDQGIGMHQTYNTLEHQANNTMALNPILNPDWGIQ